MDPTAYSLIAGLLIDFILGIRTIQNRGVCGGSKAAGQSLTASL